MLITCLLAVILCMLCFALLEFILEYLGKDTRLVSGLCRIALGIGNILFALLLIRTTLAFDWTMVFVVPFVLYAALTGVFFFLDGVVRLAGRKPLSDRLK